MDKLTQRELRDLTFCKMYDMIIVRCSACGCYLSIKKAYGVPGVSHGFCERHLAEYKRANGLED